jgi:hypothetical protein
MANFFISNRQLIKDLSINTGTTAVPVWSKICTTSEVGINTDLETQDFYVYCDALQRRLITGASVVLSGTLKLDANNAGDLELLGKVHTLLSAGTIEQFNNVEIKFDLLTSVAGGVLTYTTYTADVNLSLSDLGGAAEDVSEFSFEMTLIGKATVEASA